MMGIKVIHKQWGLGVVEDATNNTITVHFASAPKGKDQVRFQLPDAVVKGFIKSADDESKAGLDKLMAGFQCDSCGKERVEVKSIDARRLCRECEKTLTETCPSCNNRHFKSLMYSISDGQVTFGKTRQCKACAEINSFVCVRCDERKQKNKKEPVMVRSETLCQDCFNYYVEPCMFCGENFIVENAVLGNDKYDDVYVCNNCLDEHTTLCRECESRVLKNCIADSKYLPSSKSICIHCAEKCERCGIAFESGSGHEAFYGWYCLDCWKEAAQSCPVCGCGFVPEEINQELCPDCVKMEEYIKRLKSIDFENMAYRQVKYSMLESCNRSQLFADLYDSCKLLEDASLVKPQPRSLHHFLVMEFMGYHVVVTYLPPNIYDDVRYSKDVTMTNFLSHAGRTGVLKAINNWAHKKDYTLNTAAGQMHILCYPVRLRVQTAHDKTYGKVWTSYGYDVIGEYGDATKFFIIGFLQ